MKNMVMHEMTDIIRDVLDQEKEKETMDSILIIDDSDISRNILRKILEQNGYKVVEASDGAKGISIYRENPN